MKWQTIESAPKDGTVILLGYFQEGGGGGNPLVAYWHRQKRQWCASHDAYAAEGHFAPSHWMNLPPPPGGQGATAG